MCVLKGTPFYLVTKFKIIIQYIVISSLEPPQKYLKRILRILLEFVAPGTTKNKSFKASRRPKTALENVHLKCLYLI